MNSRHLAGLAPLVGTIPVRAIDFNNLNLDHVVKGGQGALKPASLTDGDIRDLTAKSCVEMDNRSRVAAPGDACTTRLSRVMKDMPASIDGQTVDDTEYVTKDVDAWAMANGCVRVYSGGGKSSMLTSHPSSADRAANLQKRIDGKA